VFDCKEKLTGPGGAGGVGGAGGGIGLGGGRRISFGASTKKACPSSVRPTVPAEATIAVKRAPSTPNFIAGAALALTSPKMAPVAAARDMAEFLNEILIGSAASNGWNDGLLSRLKVIVVNKRRARCRCAETALS
jgi:hypothetical protein